MREKERDRERERVVEIIYKNLEEWDAKKPSEKTDKSNVVIIVRRGFASPVNNLIYLTSP